MIGEESSCIQEKQSLLKKYDLMVENLSYEYIKKCSDVKTLEKIIKIFRSGEEGDFPDLLTCAENQLRGICPSNRLLIKPEPIPSLSSLNVNDRNKISYEMASWSEEMKKRDSLLKGAEDKESSDIPPIRTYGENMKKATNAKKKISIKSLDYEAWDKYDPDKEIMKMEIEEEKEREEHARRMENKHLDNKPDTLIDVGHYSDSEKQVYSFQEKDRGNECFKAGQYEQATHYYTRSITILPNVAAYNNRAIANLKLKKYGEVIMDCNEVLKRDAENVKALFRRGNAHESKGFYNEAMRDFERVLEVDPNNSLARSHVSHLKNKLEETNEGKPKKARMVVEDMKSFEEDLKSIQIFDKKIQPNICSKPSIPNWKGYPCDPVSSGDNKLNEWGYPRVMCNCTSIPLALQKKHIPHPKEISRDDDCLKELDMESSFTPYNFLKVWNQISNDEDLNKHASLLKRIGPSNLSTVFGKNLDGDMFSKIIACLSLHFSDDENLLLDFLVAISQLPRFKTIILFLSVQEKNVMDALFQKLEQSGKHQIPEGLKTSYILS